MLDSFFSFCNVFVRVALKSNVCFLFGILLNMICKLLLNDGFRSLFVLFRIKNFIFLIFIVLVFLRWLVSRLGVVMIICGFLVRVNVCFIMLRLLIIIVFFKLMGLLSILN